jgi:hypothetical protein
VRPLLFTDEILLTRVMRAPTTGAPEATQGLALRQGSDYFLPSRSANQPAVTTGRMIRAQIAQATGQATTAAIDSELNCSRITRAVTSAPAR